MNEVKQVAAKAKQDIGDAMNRVLSSTIEEISHDTMALTVSAIIARLKIIGKSDQYSLDEAIGAVFNDDLARLKQKLDGALHSAEQTAIIAAGKELSYRQRSVILESFKLHDLVLGMGRDNDKMRVYNNRRDQMLLKSLYMKFLLKFKILDRFDIPPIWMSLPGIISVEQCAGRCVSFKECGGFAFMKKSDSDGGHICHLAKTNMVKNVDASFKSGTFVGVR